jgi:hypothetical protein
MLFFSMGVAPVVFGILPDRHLAGTVVDGSIARLHMLGYVTCVIALACTLFERKWLQAGLSGLALALVLVSGLVVTPPMAEIRAHGAIETMPLQAPERQRFDFLHQVSVGVMSVNLIATGILVGLRSRVQ